MDPNTALSNLLAAILAADRDEAHEAVDALIDWIDADGFVPEGLATR